MRLIDADAIPWQECLDTNGYTEPLDKVIAVIQNMPTIEAEPKHGRWVWNKRLGEWYCSNCDRIMNPYTVEKSEGAYEMAQPFYCGWCGAKMKVE